MAGPPECRPLKTVEEMLEFDPCCVEQACRSSVPLPASAAATAAARPRLLACHDMRGGYLEDRLVEGGSDSGFYYFRHWNAIDLFVYFSHHLVTIPPVGWIHAGHRHGVPVLGTFITEWDEGAERCRALFCTAAASERTASQLAAVAAAHGFDGWVINIENKMERDHIAHLLHFLRVLTAQLREACGPRSEVVWYDAVTTEGELRWQDSLTELNRPFFEASTALWVNYTWKAGTLKAVQAAAGERCGDVFMGIDLFGRGTYGGGGYSCGVALEAARAAGLSAALFAIGWPWDAEHDPADAPHWKQRDERLWGAVATAWARRRPLLERLPLRTNFCVGSGRCTVDEGRTVSPAPWYHLCRQGLQPSLQVWPLNSAGNAGGGTAAPQQPSQQAGSSLTAAPTHSAAFCGGSCVRIAGELQGDAWLVSLFTAAVDLPPGGLNIGWAEAVCCDGVQTALTLTLAAPGMEGSACVLLIPAGADGGSLLRQLARGVLGDGMELVLIQPCEDSSPQPPAPAVGALAPQPPQLELQPVGWGKRRYQVGPDALPAIVAAGGWQLMSVDLLVLPAGEGAVASGEARIFLGELCIESLAVNEQPGE